MISEDLDQQQTGADQESVEDSSLDKLKSYIKSDQLSSSKYKISNQQEILTYKILEDKKVIDGLESTYLFHLQPTFGHTIGNGMRRILLSCLSQWGIAAIAIKGHSHLFNGINGIKEDPDTIVLNLRKVVFRYSNEPQFGKIFRLKIDTSNMDNGGVVHADRIQTEGELEVVNGDLPLFTVDLNNRIDFTIVVVFGTGYKRADSHVFSPELSSDFICVDTYFAPVLNCSYSVEQYTGGSNPYDILTLCIRTNGALSPIQALKEACHIFANSVTNLSAVVDESKKIPQNEVVDSDETTTTDPILDMSIEQLPNMPSRLQKALIKNPQIRTLRDIISMSPNEILCLEGIGSICYQDLVTYLDVYGIALNNTNQRGKTNEKK